MRDSVITNPETIEALKELYKERGKLLHPRDIVETARNKFSPLHSYFEWEDSVAAEKYRIEQARELLQKVYVKIQMPDGNMKMTQIFVSLISDREKGGYRTLVDVLSNIEMRKQLIQDALRDMQIFTNKYNTLRELASVFSAIKKVKKKLVEVR